MTKSFDAFVKKLLDKPSKKTTLLIKGKKKKIKAMGRFVTKKYPDNEYLKMVFDDQSFLFVILDDQELYYSDEYFIDVSHVTDEMIGEKKIVEYRGKKYKLATKDDYQFCLQLYVGRPSEIETECRFSDYFPVKGPKEFLSLGWLSVNGKRADINPKIISLEEIEVV